MTLAPAETTTIRSRLDQAMATSAATVTTYVHCTVERFRNRDDAGMTTAEYAVGILAAVAFAGVLLAIVKSGTIQAELQKVITGAIKSKGK
ncbi:DUF4244 domain-containing protein [Dermatophilus congolensis]|uniref:DUF4244 domain-containing protein n=1 Tax=Dermatophilus congolensis TaxID=1863 RepID=A0A239VCJ3_9MICO|nr:DUF4244 domain-containing protein [Dermatophilus congolensis]SNV19134.1 Uncharacterised protein [Dermatophilus congolensis]